MKLYQFQQCHVRVDLDREYTETVFADGTTVPAAPHHDDAQARTAEDLGYGADVAAMCREHELLHTWLCERLGMPYSPTLWAVAHDQDEGCISIPEQHREEALVMAFQAYLNGREPRPPLARLTARGLSLDTLRDQAMRLFRHGQSAATQPMHVA